MAGKSRENCDLSNKIAQYMKYTEIVYKASFIIFGGLRKANIFMNILAKSKARAELCAMTWECRYRRLSGNDHANLFLETKCQNRLHVILAYLIACTYTCAYRVDVPILSILVIGMQVKRFILEIKSKSFLEHFSSFLNIIQ